MNNFFSNNFFSGLFLKASAWSLSQALGKKRGADALAHAAPVLGVIAGAADQYGQIALTKAAKSGGSVGGVINLMQDLQAAQAARGQ